MVRAWWLIGAIAFVAVDVILWYLSAKVSASLRPAFVGAASAWGVAVVGFGSGLIGAWRGHLYATRAALQAECRAAYARLVVFADQYLDARTRHSNAKASLAKAKEAASSARSGTAEAKEAAEVVSLAEANLLAATDRLNQQLDEFVQARATVWLLASRGVQDSLRSLSHAAGGNEEDFQAARDAFVDVVRKDLGLPPLPAPTAPA